MSVSQDEDSQGEEPFKDSPQKNGKQPPTGDHAHSDERRSSREESQQSLPKAKRVACVLCRKRKLRCDGIRPSCATCKRLERECVYDEVRRKSGPRRGYVKALEARLAQVHAQVETLLKTQDDQPKTDTADGATVGPAPNMQEFQGMPIDGINADFSLQYDPLSTNPIDDASARRFSASILGMTGEVPDADGADMSWEMIGLGLDEPLPTQDVVDDLNRIFFERVHPTLPMMHRPRFHAAMNLAPHMRPPVCLRYAMWANAAAVSDEYQTMQEHFYLRARKYIQQDEMKGHGESMLTIGHCQAWVWLSVYEFRLMFFPRAWMSAGRATRMIQMMGAHRLDGQRLEVKQCLPPPKDSTELEERRRTFWACFCIDRYSSIGTGWPMSLEEAEISTNLPADEDAYANGRSGANISLSQVFEPSSVPRLNAFSSIVLMAALFGRNLLHLHRPQPDDREDDVNGTFWRRHRHLDNILLNTALGLPDKLRLPTAINSPNAIFLNLSMHTSTICLHQAAIFKADKHRLPGRLVAESKMRCITAASEIASVMRQICHLDMSTLNPFAAFCLYVAARVFVQYLRARPGDTSIQSSLQFLLSAMRAIKVKNPLTESFLVQLEVDVESAGLKDIILGDNATTASNGPMREFRCGPEHIRPPVYGDNGAAMYNDPHGLPPSKVHDTSHISQQQANGDHFQLPNRQKTPGSAPSSSANQEVMDTSEDGSAEQQTPSSNQNPSSHTSNTACSPSDRQAPPSMRSFATPYGIDSVGNPTGLFDAEMDFSHFFPNSESMPAQGFVLPQEWGDGDNHQQQYQQQQRQRHRHQQHKGDTGGPASMMTPGTIHNNDMAGVSQLGNIGGMMGFNDADLIDVMNSAQPWNTMFHDQVGMADLQPTNE